MTDTEQEAIKRAWLARVDGLTWREASASHRKAFTAGYLAHQEAVATELEALRAQLRAELESMRTLAIAFSSPSTEAACDRKLAELDRRSKQEGSG